MKKTLLVMFVLVASASAADAQVLTAVGSAVPGLPPLNGINAKVDGTLSLQAGQTCDELKLELGTTTNGVFTVSNNPNATKTLNVFVPVNNVITYTHTFLQMSLAAGTYTVKVTPKVTKMTILGKVIVYQTPAYANLTVN